MNDLETVFSALAEPANAIPLAAFALGVVFLAFWLYAPALADWRHRRRITKTLRGLGRESMENVVLPDGLDGYAYIERLVLTPQGLLVVDTRDYAGAIFGASAIDTWTQVVGNRSYRFANPVHENELRLAAVRATVGEVPVAGRVVFTGDTSFPKGKPDDVSLLAEVPEDLASLREGEVSAALESAWAVIKNAASEAARRPRRKDLGTVGRPARRRARRRPLVPALLAIAVLGGLLLFFP